jgi:RNA polymerase sigma-70 factor (ECF subfamily)
MNAIRLTHASLLMDAAEQDADHDAKVVDDRTRLRALVEAHYDFIWRSMKRLSVPPADLADCVQQVFLVASRKLSTIAEGSERSFLIGTALRVASDARRARERRREVPEDEAASPCCPGPQPDEIADQRRLRALLDEVLAAMPEDLRVVFILFELEEMPTQEIAALLDLPSGTVASRLRRAREEFDRRVARLRAATPARGGQR